MCRERSSSSTTRRSIQNSTLSRVLTGHRPCGALPGLSKTSLPNAAGYSARDQFTVNINAVLSPPLEHPTSAEPPLGVRTLTLIVPGPVITPVVKVTFICSLLVTEALRTLPSTTACDDATKWLPLIVIVTPCWTCAKLTVLGANDPISGTGRALPHNGFSVLLQPASKTAPSTTRHRPHHRENIEALPMGSGPPRTSSFGSAPTAKPPEARLLLWRIEPRTRQEVSRPRHLPA